MTTTASRIPWLVAAGVGLVASGLVGVAVAASAGTPASATGPAAASADLTTAPAFRDPVQRLERVTETARTPLLDAVGEPADTLDPTPDDGSATPPTGALAIVGFAASTTTVHCNLEAPHDAPQYISFTWQTTGAARVFFGVATHDAQAEPMFTDLPPSGTTATAFPAGYEQYTFSCGNDSLDYTLTAIDGQGNAVHRTVTIVNAGD